MVCTTRDSRVPIAAAFFDKKGVRLNSEGEKVADSVNRHFQDNKLALDRAARRWLSPPLSSRLQGTTAEPEFH